ncbi:MAG: VacJ family lipoprotein [Alphaproteobacteria bacterium]|uniref:MlaA family lipoprotein n=1 Tax=Pacificispira sp. TaxID=2888761 RepID=UPI001B0AE19F|nr:VacJ family lipoprotein [Alphaproteobacteria bacterium]
MPAGLVSIASIKRLCAGIVLSVALVGCATAPTDPVEREIYDEANDPVQPLNEAIFEFNMAVDRAVLRPVAQAYEFILPDLVRDGVRNFLRHIKTPVILANDLMQGDIDRAGETMGRFIFNTVAGFGGVFDVAGEAGIEYHQEDFGQTLAVWGVEEGPYLMLPFIGPSSGRDAIGIIVDAGLDPLRWWGYNSDDFVIENNGLIRTVAEAVDTRSRNYKQLEDLEETSLDFYATVRSLYRQQRESLIRNGVPDDDALPNIGFEGYEGIDTESDGKDIQASLVN